MKADAKIFKGIEYVQVSELPHTQREILTQTINPDLFIKLLVDGKIISGCLQYKHYNQWYQEHFQSQVTPVRGLAPGKEVETKTNPA